MTMTIEIEHDGREVLSLKKTVRVNDKVYFLKDKLKKYLELEEIGIPFLPNDFFDDKMRIAVQYIGREGVYVWDIYKIVDKKHGGTR